MTTQQLRKVENVKISNKYGTIEFLEPICLIKKNLAEALKIAQDNIEIVDPELEEKRVRMTFVNFGHFKELKVEERSKLLKRMRLWITQYDMTEISHDEQTGELVVETED